MEKPKQRAAESSNSEMASGDQAMKRQCSERQASLKPALVKSELQGCSTCSMKQKQSVKQSTKVVLVLQFKQRLLVSNPSCNSKMQAYPAKCKCGIPIPPINC